MENEVEVMRVVRVPPRGDLVIWVGADRYQHISNINDNVLKRRVLAAIGELIVFADGYEALVEAGSAPPLTTGIENEKSELERQRAAFLASLERERNTMQAAESQVPGSVQPAGTQEAEATAEIGSLSIAEMINPFISKHLAAEPKLAGRSMRLETDPNGSLSIIVDDKTYRRPEEIEDLEMRRILRASLKEWDES